MDSSNNLQVYKLSTILLKPQFDGSQTNWNQQKTTTKAPQNHSVGYNIHKTTKCVSKIQKSDWRNITNSTNTNWGNLSSKNWKNSTQSQWKSTFKNMDDTKKKDSTQEKIVESQQNTVTLDQYMGKGYISVSLAGISQSQFEGSEPPVDIELKYLEEEDFEINETDEDKYSESNTQSRQVDSNQNKKRKSKQKQRSIDNDNTVLLGDAKIKQKILDKYSKNLKQKPHKQVLSILEAHKRSIEQITKSELGPSDEFSPIVNMSFKPQSILPSFTEVIKRNQCLSQSPVRTMMDKNLSETQKVPQSNVSKLYYIKSYEDNKNVSGHIAFRNSFYNHKKSQDQVNNLNKGKIIVSKSQIKKYADDDLNIKNFNCLTQQKLSCYKEMVVKKELISERQKHRNHHGSLQLYEN